MGGVLAVLCPCFKKKPVGQAPSAMRSPLLDPDAYSDDETRVSVEHAFG